MEELNLRLFDTDPNTQTTELTGLSTEMKTYYEKRLLDHAEPKLVHDQFGDKYPIPKNGGKTIEFRKYSPLPKSMTPLTEGVTPNGTSLTVTPLTAEVAQYGDYVQLSDLLELTAIDRNVEQATKLLGGQAGRTLDTVTREVLNGGTNVLYAPSVSGETETAITSRTDMTSSSKFTPDMAFKAAAKLKSMNAEPYDDSFVAIIHPLAAYDLMRSEEWIDVHKYAQPENIYNGEIGKLGQVRFVETTEAKVWGPGAISNNTSRLTVKTAVTVSGTSVTVNEILTAGTYAGDDAIPCYVAGEENTIVAIANNTTYSTLTLGTATTVAKDAIICGQGAGKDGSAVFSTLVIGANAYGTTEVEGGGLQHIVKQLGYGEDPLNQRSSVGWKATKVAERLVEAYMVRVESGSAYSATAESN